MGDIIDSGNEAAELFLKVALANRERCNLKSVGACHYCGESVRSGLLFCAGPDCSADWHEEQRRKKIAGNV